MEKVQDSIAIDVIPGGQTEHPDVRDYGPLLGTKFQHNSREIGEYY
jgi:hypothetical protein